ncbi:MAG: acyltransferase [Actinomycetales bacterium]|nr:acyltransferase [Actinomycetales bacterium]
MGERADGDAPAAPRRIRDLAAATPAGRDRYVDLLRAVSILAVVLGHWTVTAAVTTPQGLGGVNLLDIEPWTHPLTWLFQVMPVFFLVGGYANAASLAGHHGRGGSAVAWVRGRALRLLRPTAVLLGVLLVVRVVAVALGANPDEAHLVVWTATSPLWFVVVYLAVVLLAPAAVAAHRRWGLGVVVALVAIVAVGDVLRLATGSAAPATGSYLAGWLAVHQVGIAWQHGALPVSRRAGWAMAVAGLGTAVLLTGPGPYGVAMVGAATPPGLTNTAPPTLALLALATAQTGVVVLLRRRATAWLVRPRVWTGVVAVNAVILTIFLWHMTAAVIGGYALVATGVLPEPAVGSGVWWALRVPWVAALGVVLLGLVVVWRRFEAPLASDRVLTSSTPAVVAGLLMILAALASLGVTAARGAAPQVAGLPVVELGLIAAGLVVLVRAGRPGAAG